MLSNADCNFHSIVNGTQWLACLETPCGCTVTGAVTIDIDSTGSSKGGTILATVTKNKQLLETEAGLNASDLSVPLRHSMTGCFQRGCTFNEALGSCGILEILHKTDMPAELGASSP